MSLIQKALILAGLILAVSFALTQAAKNGWLEPDTTRRAQEAMTGLVLVLCANLVPKAPKGADCGLTRSQSVQRFAGWTLVLAGLGHMLSWLILPLPVARPVAMGLVATGVVLVLGRVGWAFTKDSGAKPPVAS